MNNFKIDSRLKAVASLVREGSRVADIGTDHAYLLCYLLNTGKIPSGIGADLRKGPLENARKTVIEQELTDKVELILSDGLEKLPENCADDIVLAGMGGILISEILEKAPWIYNPRISIVAQPMTHAEHLREFVIRNSFKIMEETTATDGKHIYCVIRAQYTGEKSNKDRSYYYLGELLRNNDEITKSYINKMLQSIEKKHKAQTEAGIEDKENLSELISDIKIRIEESYNG